MRKGKDVIRLALSEMGASDLVEVALACMKEITVSGYIPFTSPAPSSSEAEVRDFIRSDIRLLETTSELIESLYGEKPAAKQPAGACSECRFFRFKRSLCMVYGITVYGNDRQACCEKERGL